MVDTGRLVQVASRQVGVQEDYSQGLRAIKYNEEYYGGEVTTNPWNCTFIWWLFKESGLSDYYYNGNKTDDINTLLADWTAKGYLVIDKPYRSGDIVFLNFSGTGVPEHIGIITSYNSAVVDTIEGNTSMTDDVNGGTVMRRTRSPTNIVAVVRIGYDNLEEVPAGVVNPVGEIESVTTISSQPLMSFVELYLGDTKLTLLPPNTLISMEFNKSADNSSHTFTLTLFDDEWDTIEYLCSKHYKDVRLRYGYVSGKQSAVYTAELLDYSIEFSSSGMILNINGSTTGALSNLQNMTLDTGTTNPTEAVKSICKAVGWTVKDENFHPSKDLELGTKDTISLVNERPATSIIQLCQYAERASDGKSGYRFYLDESMNPPEAYFRPMDVSANTPMTYVYGKGIDTSVLDLSLTVNGSFGGTLIGQQVTTSLSSKVIDPDTKDITTTESDINSVRKDVVGKKSHTRKDQYKSTIDASGMKPSQMRKALQYHLASTNTLQYEGSMTIIGNPELKLLSKEDETIRLLIITERGDLHHSSGLYLVKDIVDSINDGILRTTMQIWKQEDVQGVELVTYNKLHK